MLPYLSAIKSVIKFQNMDLLNNILSLCMREEMTFQTLLPNKVVLLLI